MSRSVDAQKPVARMQQCRPQQERRFGTERFDHLLSGSGCICGAAIGPEAHERRDVEHGNQAGRAQEAGPAPAEHQCGQEQRRKLRFEREAHGGDCEARRRVLPLEHPARKRRRAQEHQRRSLALGQPEQAGQKQQAHAKPHQRVPASPTWGEPPGCNQHARQADDQPDQVRQRIRKPPQPSDEQRRVGRQIERHEQVVHTGERALHRLLSVEAIRLTRFGDQQVCARVQIQKIRAQGRPVQLIDDDRGDLPRAVRGGQHRYRANSQAQGGGQSGRAQRSKQQRAHVYLARPRSV